MNRVSFAVAVVGFAVAMAMVEWVVDVAEEVAVGVRMYCRHMNSSHGCTRSEQTMSNRTAQGIVSRTWRHLPEKCVSVVQWSDR